MHIVPRRGHEWLPHLHNPRAYFNQLSRNAVAPYASYFDWEAQRNQAEDREHLDQTMEEAPTSAVRVDAPLPASAEQNAERHGDIKTLVDVFEARLRGVDLAEVHHLVVTKVFEDVRAARHAASYERAKQRLDRAAALLAKSGVKLEATQ